MHGSDRPVRTEPALTRSVMDARAMLRALRPGYTLEDDRTEAFTQIE